MGSTPPHPPPPHHNPQPPEPPGGPAPSNTTLPPKTPAARCTAQPLPSLPCSFIACVPPLRLSSFYFLTKPPAPWDPPVAQCPATGPPPPPKAPWPSGSATPPQHQSPWVSIQPLNLYLPCPPARSSSVLPPPHLSHLSTSYKASQPLAPQVGPLLSNTPPHHQSSVGSMPTAQPLPSLSLLSHHPVLLPLRLFIPQLLTKPPAPGPPQVAQCRATPASPPPKLRGLNATSHLYLPCPARSSSCAPPPFALHLSTSYKAFSLGVPPRWPSCLANATLNTKASSPWGPPRWPSAQQRHPQHQRSMGFNSTTHLYLPCPARSSSLLLPLTSSSLLLLQSLQPLAPQVAQCSATPPSTPKVHGVNSTTQPPPPRPAWPGGRAPSSRAPPHKAPTPGAPPCGQHPQHNRHPLQSPAGPMPPPNL
ncbi:hypothetical protein GDO86_005569 [Hymenochirus boettgeri]|uniref:Uncharacterized protein n=1 Tax=Hymenochirus boettgeri TaxID=247094 RepID=A0A8T2J7H6_9PIPI|nr:hypothetical protein GDO86_005569 [Hymenochirus boettgeri]